MIDKKDRLRYTISCVKRRTCDSGVVGNARPCQGRDRGFEPRLSLGERDPESRMVLGFPGFLLLRGCARIGALFGFWCTFWCTCSFSEHKRVFAFDSGHFSYFPDFLPCNNTYGSFPESSQTSARPSWYFHRKC